MKPTKLLIFSFYALLFFVYGCSTTNHGTLPKQAYNDITAHYNAYFNANEKLKNTLKVAEDAHKDRFDTVIPVFFYTDPKEFGAYTADLDDAIKRSTQSIQLHPTANWSDDNMLLIGKSSFLKGDYDKAAGSFKYITTEYKEGVDYVKVQKSLGKKVGKYVKKKKAKKKKPVVKVIDNKDGTKTLEKEDNRPEKSIWVHTPARSEALLWLIKTYTRQKKYDQAASVVTYVRSDDAFYKNYDPQLNLTDADLMVARGNYSGAIEPLENYLKAKKIKKKKKLKTRPHFVLAQCYEAIGNYPKATANYKSVLKSRPNYDMEFYAKLKMAKLGRKSGGGNASVRSLLAKMAKDNKYSDYFDQIYYELALISIEEKNTIEARKFLHQSVDKSTTNDDQKALSFLKLAELDYEEEFYVSSKYYYDSTLAFLAKNDAAYPAVDERNKLLDNLVKQLMVIANEDSLQKLASLSKEQLNKAIKEAAAKIEKEAELKKEAENVNQQSGNNLNNDPRNPQSQTQTQQAPGSTWYFYNIGTKTNGYNEFVKKWGRRKLEENWRRKNKNSISADEILDANAAADIAATDTKKPEEAEAKTLEEKLLASIPTTPEKLAKSNDLLVDAYYNAGVIYKDGLENYPKAENMFETANSRFPKHKLLLESYYNLYLIAQKRDQRTKAETYKQKILNEFPESVIAKILRDPNYINETNKQQLAVQSYYQSTYEDYQNNRLDTAWYKAKMSDNVFKPNPLSQKFELLLALIYAKQNRLEDYVQALQKLSNKSTDIEVKKSASDLLNLLNKSSLPQVDLSKDKARLDSLNALFPAEKTPIDELKQLNEAKQQAIDKGVKVTLNAPSNQPTKEEVVATEKDKDVAVTTTENPTVKTETTAAPVVVMEDTTSPYVRSEGAVHYCIVYIKDPAVAQSTTMSTMAKINAFNSSVHELLKLQTKQVMIDSKNKLLNIRQFKNGADALAYYKSLITQKQLFEEMQSGQFVVTCISATNFSTLLSQKDIAAYQKYFERVYK